MVKTPLYVSIEKLWGKTNLKGIIFNIIFGHSAKTFRLFVKNFSAGFSILHSTHPWQHFERFLMRQVNFFYLFRKLSEKFSGSWHNFFWQGCQNCIIRVCRNNFEDKKLVWIKYNLYHFRILREKLSDFCEKVYGRVVKAAYIVFIETIWELNSLKKNTFPKSFWDTERVISGLFSKLFWRGFQNCILSVQRNTLRKNSFEKNTNIIFEHWVEKFSAFWPKFLDRVVKTEGLREHWDLFWKK